VESLGSNNVHPVSPAALRVRSSVLQSLHPSEAVSSLLPPIGEAPPPIGIHVRRTDNVFAIARSPVHEFARHMNAELLLEPSTIFYLATDCKATEASLRSQYGASLQMSPSSVRQRNTITGMQAALVDLLLLSRCRKVFGSYYSSFSILAALINEIPLHIVYVEATT